MKIEQGEIVECVMRMGVEHRSGVSLDRLHDLAAQQIKRARCALKQPTATLKSGMIALDVASHKCVRIYNVNQYAVIRWITQTIPEVQCIGGQESRL